MSTARKLYHLMRADLLERIRRPGFLFAGLLVAFIGYLVNSDQMGLYLGAYRGIFNSAWVGTLMALVITSIFPIVGFYLVKNTVERDRQTGVGQILAGTPLSRLEYVLGKYLSNLVYLSLLIIILLAAALLLQLISREDPHIDLWALFSPILFVSMPMMAVVAAVAVLFECVPWLSGGLGNVAFFFIYVTGMAVSGESLGKTNPMIEPYGIALFESKLQPVVRAAYPGYDGGFSLGVIDVHLKGTFVWTGIDWTAELILSRLLWVGVSLLVVLLAALLFNRFNPGMRRHEAKNRAANGKQDESIQPIPTAAPRLSPLGKPRFSFYLVLGAELRLLLKGKPWWWFALEGGLFIACAASPWEATSRFLLPAAWLLPILTWSILGARERLQETHQLVFSAAAPLERQLPAQWLAGVLITAACGSGALIGALLQGQSTFVFAWLAAVLFIPSLALAFGCWSNGTKLFEIVYLLLWYIGPLNAVKAVDYIGAATGGMPLLYLGLALVLMAAAWLGRKRQMMV